MLLILRIRKLAWPDPAESSCLLASEAEFSQLLNNENRAQKALEKALQTNPASPFIAKSLIRLLENKGDPDRARQALSRALEILPGDKGLNAALARLLDRHYPSEFTEAEACWRRSFTMGDTNYSSQFYFARRLYLNGKVEDAYAIFSLLKLARASRDVKTKITGWIKEDASTKRFSGVVSRLEEDYAWVTPRGQSRAIFFHRSEVDSITWSQLKTGSAVTFAIGFNYMGPAASVRQLGSTAASAQDRGEQTGSG